MTCYARRLVFLLILILQGCSQKLPDWSAEEPYPPSPAPRLGDILHTATGHYIDKSQLFSSLTRFPLVYVGEEHDNPASHRLELEILTAMQQHQPGRVSLGMEMFNHEQQSALDSWVAGELNEKEFLRESRWYDNWGGDFELFRELLEYCRDQKIPVIGLNTTRALGRKVSMTPLDQLDEETRRRIPEMDMDDPYQREMINQIFGAHGAGATMLESFTRRQTLWDETMASTVANYMQEHVDRQMVVVAGGWHIEYGFGIPRRVHRRLPLPFVVVGGDNLKIPEEKRAQLMKVELPEFPMRAVDYLVYQRYEIFPTRGVTLGVGIGEGDDLAGLLIAEVETGSPADISGIKEGDRLLQIDGKPLQEYFDLIYELKTRPIVGQVSIELKRGDTVLAVDVHFVDKGNKHP